jgi:anti-sigma regulatory factor (Ser/Thr protein kinase)
VSASVVATRPETGGHGFRHEAFFYGTEAEFVKGAGAFLATGLRAGQPALVVVSSRKIDLLRQQFGADDDRVVFADMGDVGTNPARIIPAWTDFVGRHQGHAVQGIGEPIWVERSPAEVVECQRHESLLNVAFAQGPDFNLLCPYDTSLLAPDVVAEARRSHPLLRRDGAPVRSDDYLGLEAFERPFIEPLTDPPPSASSFAFQTGSLSRLRSLVLREAMRVGLGEARAGDAVTAVNEIASNSLRHGGGSGVLRVWPSEDSLVFEVSDEGVIDAPLVGRVRPGCDAPGGRGLWMVNQLCELVQVRSSSTGSTVRMHLRRPQHS